MLSNVVLHFIPWRFPTACVYECRGALTNTIVGPLWAEVFKDAGLDDNMTLPRQRQWKKAHHTWSSRGLDSLKLIHGHLYLNNRC